MIACIIQARLGSSRLPCKVMLKLPSGRSVLEEVMYNCRQTRYRTLVASDTGLFGLADSVGSTEDVWQRFVECAETYDVDIIVRVTSDCPMLTSDVIQGAVHQYLTNDAEYVYNHNDHEPSSGDGFDVEVFSLKDLIRYGKAKEHVTTNLRKHAKKLKIDPPAREGISLNTIEDYVKIYRMLL